MRYVIRRNTAKGARYAGSQYDWTLRCNPDLIVFHTRKEAQAFMDEFVWEDDARIEVILDKTRTTRASKYSMYIQACCRDHANVDMHNTRYHRRNLQTMITYKSDRFSYIMNGEINMRLDHPLRYQDKAHVNLYMKELRNERWRRYKFGACACLMTY